MADEQRERLELADTVTDLGGDRLADGLGDIVGDDDVDRVGRTDLVSVDAAVKDTDTRDDSVNVGSEEADETSVAYAVVRADVDVDADVEGDAENERVPRGDVDDDGEPVDSADLLGDGVEAGDLVGAVEAVPHADWLGVSVNDGVSVSDAVPDIVREPAGESLGSLLSVTVAEGVRDAVDEQLTELDAVARTVSVRVWDAYCVAERV